MPTIKFERVLRDCPWNRDTKNRQKLIYDFDALIDGEKRAKFARSSFRPVGYYLEDAGGEQRRRDGRAVTSTSQQYFEATILKALDDDLIPTLAQIEEREKGKAVKKALEDAASAEARRIERIHRAGPHLLAALKRALNVIDKSEVPFRFVDDIEEATALVKQLEEASPQ